MPLKSTQERATELRMQFPVSSGQQHRKTESEWVPVSPKKPEIVPLPPVQLPPPVPVVPVPVPSEPVPVPPPLQPPGPQVFPSLSNNQVSSIFYD